MTVTPPQAPWRSPRARAALGLVGLFAAFAVAPLVVSGYRVFQLTQLLVYAIALLGINVLTGYSGQLSLGHGAFFALGAYATAILVGHEWVPYWLSPLPVGAICFAVGWLFGRPAARLEGIYLALATFGLSIATPQVLKLDALQKWTGGSQGIPVPKPSSPDLWLASDDQWFYGFCLIVATAAFALTWNLVRGRSGRALLALRDHPIAAASMGVPVAAYKSMAFGTSALLTGVAGGLGAMLSGFISPDSFTSLLSIQFLVGSVVGGVTSIFGALFGAAFIEVVPDLASGLSTAAPWAIYGALLILCMMAMPTGVVGLWRSARARVAAARAEKARKA